MFVLLYFCCLFYDKNIVMCAFQMITFLFSLLDLMHQLLFLFLFLAYEISGEVIYILFIMARIMNLLKAVYWISNIIQIFTKFWITKLWCYIYFCYFNDITPVFYYSFPLFTPLIWWWIINENKHIYQM